MATVELSHMLLNCPRLTGCSRSVLSRSCRVVGLRRVALLCATQKLAAAGLTSWSLSRRYPQDTMHDVATKELEYVQGYGDSIDEAYLPSPGFTPEDGYMVDSDGNVPDDAMSPEARDLLRRAAAVKGPGESNGAA